MQMDRGNGSLYPALYRLEDRGWIASFQGTSENNRKAKYYLLTPVGRKQLAAQTSRWERLVKGIRPPATEDVMVKGFLSVYRSRDRAGRSRLAAG